VLEMSDRVAVENSMVYFAMEVEEKLFSAKRCRVPNL
jgi:hypothetical protein